MRGTFGGYVAPPNVSCVEDFDSRHARGDVTYCPKRDFPFAEAPLTRFAAHPLARIVWHSNCSLNSKRLQQRPQRIRTIEQE
jgi:hypothetical protein